MKYCYKCPQKATITIEGKDYCSLHGIEISAIKHPKLIVKNEERILKGKDD